MMLKASLAVLLLCCSVALSLPSSLLTSSLIDESTVPNFSLDRLRPLLGEAESPHELLMHLLQAFEGVGEGSEKELDNYFRFVPTFVTAIKEGGNPVNWNATCFHSNSATLKLEDSYMDIDVDSEDAASLLCSDFYLFATVEGLHFKTINRHGEHDFRWKLPSSTNALARQWVATHGVYVFSFPHGAPASLSSLASTVAMFLPALVSPGIPTATLNANRKFLKDDVGYDMPERTVQKIELDESELHSGDFLAIIRLDGLDPMIAMGMGSHTGHTATIQRIDGELYVTESTDKTGYWPKGNIQRTPWKEWLELAEKANFNVIHLPLSAAAREIYNETAAQEWFTNGIEGLPYGYHNFLLGWIDTIKDNFPVGLSGELLEIGMGVIAGVNEVIANKMWVPAINFRLGTEGLDTMQLYAEIASRGKTFMEVLIEPEQDSWIYSDGKSMVCNVFVCEHYKAAGMFGELADQIQCTETTNWDVYALNFFSDGSDTPAKCKEADPELPWCQILGRHRMSLPGASSKAPYAHYAEHCPGQPPLYERPPTC